MALWQWRLQLSSRSFEAPSSLLKAVDNSRRQPEGRFLYSCCHESNESSQDTHNFQSERSSQLKKELEFAGELRKIRTPTELEPTTVRLRCWYIDLRLTNTSTMVSEKKISTQTCKTLLYHQQFQNVSLLQGTRSYPQMHCNSIGQTPPPRGVHRLLLYARARLELPHLVTGSPRTKTSPMLGWLQLSGWGTKTVQEINPRISLESLWQMFWAGLST